LLQRAQDRDKRSIHPAQRMNRRVRRYTQAELRQGVLRPPPLVSPTNSPSPPRRVATHPKILGHRCLVEQTEVLVHESEPGSLAATGSYRQWHRLTAHSQAAATIWGVVTGQDLDQR